jgi:hypothetical protein
MVKGSVYIMKRRCGRPTCACVTGERHASTVLSWSEDGRHRIMMIPPDRVSELKERTGRYRRFRRARARLVKVQGKMLDVIDRLDDALRENP